MWEPCSYGPAFQRFTHKNRPETIAHGKGQPGFLFFTIRHNCISLIPTTSLLSIVLYMCLCVYTCLSVHRRFECAHMFVCAHVGMTAVAVSSLPLKQTLGIAFRPSGLAASTLVYEAIALSPDFSILYSFASLNIYLSCCSIFFHIAHCGHQLTVQPHSREKEDGYKLLILLSPLQVLGSQASASLYLVLGTAYPGASHMPGEYWTLSVPRPSSVKCLWMLVFNKEFFL